MTGHHFGRGWDAYANLTRVELELPALLQEHSLFEQTNVADSKSPRRTFRVIFLTAVLHSCSLFSLKLPT
jgi:hypothetical protein